MTVACVTKITSSSTKSFEDATTQGVERAATSVGGITGLEVMSHTAKIENGKIAEYRVTMEVRFSLECMSQRETALGEGRASVLPMSDVPRVTPAEAHEKMKGEAFTYVDVRTEEEFAVGHPEGAVNVPLLMASAGAMVPNAEFLSVMEAAFAKDAPLVIGCKMGGRSARAAQMLIAAGFTRVVEQSSGWEGTKGTFGELIVPGWSRTSLPTETGHPEGRSYAALRNA